MLEAPQRFESYGAVVLYDLVKVLELDASGFRGFHGIVTIGDDVFRDIASRTAIIVPIKNEELLTLEGVISAIPHDSLVIVVSASDRKPVDRYRHEVDLAKVLNHTTRRGIVVFHQKDEAWVEALADTQLELMLGEDGVRSGKGEGMLLGVIAAAALGYRYIGFIDSDNYVPGSVNEYARIYYAGFHLLESEYSMVRIKWPFKGKLASSDMYLRRRGRVSRITNRFMNTALSLVRKVETDIIKTGNSGEHALTTRLALSMKWAGGYAVEPYQLVYLLEECYLNIESGSCPALPHQVKILQVEARNPHIHAEKGDEHINSMIAKSLGTIYHSKLAVGGIRREIEEVLSQYQVGLKPVAPRIYDPRDIDASKVFTQFISNSRDALILEGV
ncbi:MAG: mannosyl-3-phosphoglycerate synthase [Desulfurococcales archaeon]|nr:mannosyl-3-phosphoglycerate synthase [Desulfurococcales archaeon]